MPIRYGSSAHDSALDVLIAAVIDRLTRRKSIGRYTSL